MSIKRLYLCPFVALLIISFLPPPGGSEGAFTLTSAETGPGGAPLPLNHTVEVGHSTLYRARAFNGLNRTVSVEFTTRGLPSGATVSITPPRTSMGAGESLEIEILLTLTESLSYTTPITTFEVLAVVGESTLSSLPVTFVPTFHANFTAVWENMKESTNVSGFVGQRIFSSLIIENFASFQDDIILDVVSAPPGVNASFPEEGETTIYSLPPGKDINAALLIDMKEPGEGEVVLRATSMASLHQQNPLSITLFLGVNVMDDLPLNIRPSPGEVWLEEDLPVNVTVDVRNPNPHPLSIYLTVDVGGGMADGMLEVAASPEEVVTLQPGEVARWILTCKLTGLLSSDNWGIVKLRFWDEAGVLLGTSEIMVHVKALPEISVDTGPTAFIVPSGRGEMNLTLINTGNCPVTGFLYVTQVPSGLSVILPSELLHLQPGETSNVKAVITAEENLTPGEFSVKFVFNGFYTDPGLIPYTKNFTGRVNVVGEPHLMVEFIHPEGYLLVNQSGPSSLVVVVSNTGTAPSSTGSVYLYEVSRSLSRQLVSTRTIPSLPPGRNLTLSFSLTPSLSTVSIEVVVATEGGSSSAKLPVTFSPKQSTPPSPAPGGISGGAVVATATFSALAGAFAAVVLFRHESAQYALGKALIPLYSKLSSEDILNNKIRKEIYQYIRNHPGEHFRSILINLGLTNGTLAYHLYTLEKEEFIKSRKDGLYRRFYPTGYKVEPVVPTNGMGRIYRLIMAEPGITQKEVSARLGIPSSSVNYSVKKLQSQGLIEIKREGRYTRLYPSHRGG